MPKSRWTPKKDSPDRAKYPRHPLEKALRLPRLVLEQNAGKQFSPEDAATFLQVKMSGAVRLEISSALKFGLLEKQGTGRLGLSALAKKILRPQHPGDELAGLREAVQQAPEIGDVYRHYRGENLPDTQFFDNTLTDTFRIPRDKVQEFKSVLLDTLQTAQLVQELNGKYRILDISTDATRVGPTDNIKKLGRDVTVSATDTCFVVMPFALPLGGHYTQIFEPAITKAGLKPIRADNEIFTTGKIIDQIWTGLNSARVLVAELTGRNPNVFYELGLAHALKKPVVLVSSNEEDVPFDVRHIRVIYYDVNDPFWGEKLINKVAENILSALRNPAEAIFSAPGAPA